MYYLKRRYHNDASLDFNNLKEKDIISICRDIYIGSKDIKQDDLVKYENEIVSYLIRYRLDPLKLDDAGNILLTYPVVSNSFKLVNYLLNSYYNLKEYSESPRRKRRGFFLFV